MPELRVAPGERLRLTASHDTYGISFSLDDNDEAMLRALSTGVPLKVGRLGRRAPAP